MPSGHLLICGCDRSIHSDRPAGLPALQACNTIPGSVGPNGVASYVFPHSPSSYYYSFFKTTAGLDRATFNVCDPIIRNAIQNTAMVPDKRSRIPIGARFTILSITTPLKNE